jgi:hypothetical protein
VNQQSGRTLFAGLQYFSRSGKKVRNRLDEGEQTTISDLDFGFSVHRHRVNDDVGKTAGGMPGPAFCCTLRRLLLLLTKSRDVRWTKHVRMSSSLFSRSALMQIGQDSVFHAEDAARQRGTVLASHALPAFSTYSPAHGSSRSRGKQQTSSVIRSSIRTWAVSVAVGASAVLAGCSTNSSDLVHLPDGQSGFAINCSGAGSGSGWSDCYQKAGDACGASGYDIVSKDNDDGAAAGGGLTSIATANVKSRSMVIRCK